MTIRDRLLLLFAFVLLWTRPVCAQQVWHDEAIRTFQGLPSDIVISSQTDDKGFLYVATAKGLSRYDGYRFLQHKSVRNAVNGLVYDGSRFYFHNAVGLFAVDDIRAKPLPIAKNNYEDELPDNDHFENIFTDSHGRVWSNDFSNLKYFARGASNPVIFALGLDRKDEHLDVKFIEVAPGVIWALTSKGVFVWTHASNRIKKHPDASLSNLNCTSAIRVSKSRILIASATREIFRVDPANDFAEKIAVTPEPLIGFAKLPGRSLYAYSRNNVYALEKNGPTVIFTPQKSQINHVFGDAAAEMLWVSTNKGLVKLSQVDAVANYRLPTSDGLNRVIVSIAEDADRTLWLVDNRNGIWSRDAEGKWHSFAIPGAKVNVVNAYRHSVFFGTDKGLYGFSSGRIEKVPLEEFRGSVKKTLVLNNGAIWILCTNGPIQRFSPDFKSIKKPFSNKPEFWTENTWNDLCQSRDGRIWLAGWAPKDYGIDRLDDSGDAFVEISDLRSNADRDKFFGDYVNRIAEMPNGNMLFSGYGGFCIVKPDGELIKKIDVNSYPISDGRFEGITALDHGNIAFATGDGLYVYNQRRDDVMRFSQLDGLPADDLVYGFLRRSDGKIALGTENGFSLLNPERLLKPLPPRPLRLSAITVDGKMRERVSGAIALSKDESDAVLSFSDLSFSDRNKLQFRYRFKDENHWSDLGSTPEISLNHIAPGTYGIEIQKRDLPGDWQSDALDLVLIAHPPFYRSPIFYVLCFVIAILAITGIYSYLLRRQRKEALYRQQLREAEMTTLRAQMNPHFMFNTLNSINSYIIQNQSEAASEYLTTFSKLMRSILDYSKQELIPLENELQALKLYMELESMRLEHSFDYTIKVDDELRNDTTVKIPPLVIQPFVENAIWHGLLHKNEPGNLFVTALVIDETHYRVTITDDGIGRENAAQLKTKQTSHKSYGVGITTERLMLHHPENFVETLDIKDADGHPKGTSVIITLKR